MKGNLEVILESYSQPYFPILIGEIEKDAQKEGRYYTKVYDIMSKIAVGLTKAEDWMTYRNQHLLTEGSNEFQLNLFPLGKKNLKEWSSDYEKAFGFVSKKEYIEYVRGTRFKILREFWEESKPKYTLCFGMSHLNEFKSALALEQLPWMTVGEFQVCKEKRVVVTPFFVNFLMSGQRINELVAILHELD